MTLHADTISGSEDFAGERLLARHGFRLREHLVHSSNDFGLTLRPIVETMRFAGLVFSGEALLGDARIFALEEAP
jgi:hypothetical protein